MPAQSTLRSPRRRAAPAASRPGNIGLPKTRDRCRGCGWPTSGRGNRSLRRACGPRSSWRSAGIGRSGVFRGGAADPVARRRACCSRRQPVSSRVTLTRPTEFGSITDVPITTRRGVCSASQSRRDGRLLRIGEGEQVFELTREAGAQRRQNPGRPCPGVWVTRRYICDGDSSMPYSLGRWARSAVSCMPLRASADGARRRRRRPRPHCRPTRRIGSGKRCACVPTGPVAATLCSTTWRNDACRMSPRAGGTPGRVRADRHQRRSDRSDPGPGVYPGLRRRRPGPARRLGRRDHRPARCA